LHGSNLWRSTQVFLDGIKAKPGSIEVLPDMEGIEAQFDATLLRKRSWNAGKVSLKVWTRDGFADYPVEITGESKGGSCLDGPRPKPAKFQLVSIVPDTVSSCLSESKKTEFVLTLRGLNLRSTKSTTTGTETETETEKKAGEDFYVHLGGKDVKADRMHNFGKNEKHIDILKIGVDAKDIKLKYWQGLGSIPLLVLGEKHIINHDIPIRSVPTEMCGKAPPTSGKFDAAATSIHSVSGDGVIDVCVSKLMLGLKNAKGGLERVRHIEWLGQKVTPAPGPGGKSAHAVFDKLPRLEKRGADQLPLRLIGASKKILGTLQVKTACDRTTGQSAASVNKSMRGS
ncbi:MAG: hypothetical protein JAZ17_19935, partial [Candidatus Thiodiazotropha endolucinida]|nr:hypothetical protein [Candidatus Thiodiazotropha endolucinida]